jgi:hypothetical protein
MVASNKSKKVDANLNKEPEVIVDSKIASTDLGFNWQYSLRN